MPHTKSHDQHPSASGEKDFKRGFTIYGRYFLPYMGTIVLNGRKAVTKKLLWITLANNINPDQNAPNGKQSDLGPYCLQYGFPKCMSKWQIFVNGGKRFMDTGG